MGKICLDDMLGYGHDHFVWITPRYNLINASPFGHKAVLFEPAMEHNGTAEQKARWLPLARSGKIMGTYAQTELGQGSFVRGIETTATFDRDTDEFVIHSSTVSSAKFWPAGLGFSTTHGTVMARLIVGDKDHGPHLFVVQLRSIDDGKPIPGIKMGDVGLKLGYNEADNGFATFKNVHAPRSHMLMAHSQVSRNGTYTKDPLRAKLSYLVMLLVRGKMPGVFTVQLAQATTIATRYSVVREQDLAVRWPWVHGYFWLTGGTTFEGENYVLWQQVGRHLLKQLDRFQDGESIEPQMQYLTNSKDYNAACTASGEQFLDAEVQLSIYRNRAHRLIVKAHTAIRSSGRTLAEAWNEHMMLHISASRAHIEYLVLKSFGDTIASLPDTTSSNLGTVLSHVCSLFALSTVINPRSVDALSFLETNGTQAPYLNCVQLDTIRALVNDLLDKLLPDAIALTDAWDFSDTSLCSTLGMYNGDVYGNMMRWVEQLPINQKVWENDGVQEGWKDWVDPILKQEMEAKAKL
ncbi:acyl-CoA dehydrogenase NM domain-like protein [Clathrospora elynae]|uniref:Acyl-CoA dehydrogenase NM domain-like protein n=1 Tax=Clathrospora elynae TaxID=706981 RepID=A0A6A5SWU4_9PLEO|nr:acyl-CoA dehydrogenase NM domain-like protein [Clathrospora elynae]